MIGRKKRDREEGGAEDGSDVAAESVEGADEPEGLSPRPDGPWDLSERPDAREDEQMLDLGALLIRGFDGLQMQVQMDEEMSTVSLVTLSDEAGSLQVQAFAAPRSTGIWQEIREQLATSITGSGGLVEDRSGEFGVELSARVPGQGGSLQPARFVGVDGPRWFLRGLFYGSAATPDAAPRLERLFKDIVVDRGDEALPVGGPLPMRLPPTQAGSEVGDDS